MSSTGKDIVADKESRAERDQVNVIIGSGHVYLTTATPAATFF